MTFELSLVWRSMRCALALFALGVLSTACNEGSAAPPRPVVFIDNFDGGGEGNGCVQPNFPADQPDLFVLSPPRFLLTNSISQDSTSGQAQVDQGEVIEAEITVNAATRQVRVELADVWNPRIVIYSEDMQTAGNTTIPLLLSPSAARGRYYMRLTLCTNDCRDKQVVYDVVRCEPGSNELCAHNVPYERMLFEDSEITQVDPTCIELDNRPGFGSGTVVIQ